MFFRFQCKRDFDYVDVNGPWHFNKHMLVLRSLERDDSITISSLCETSFWIRMYNVPMHQRTVPVVSLLGAKVGVVQQVEEEQLWNRCIRIRVKLRVDKPLQRGLFLNDSAGRRTWVYFRYERLPEFCYWCGYIGHSEKDCSGWDGEGEVVQWPYDPLLRASPSRARKLCYGTQFSHSAAASGSAASGSDSYVPSAARRSLFLDKQVGNPVILGMGSAE